jgi:hypothetical protein
MMAGELAQSYQYQYHQRKGDQVSNFQENLVGQKKSKKF